MGTVDDLRTDFRKLTVEQRAAKIREIRRERRYVGDVILKKKEKSAKKTASANLSKLLAKMSPDEIKQIMEGK